MSWPKSKEERLSDARKELAQAHIRLDQASVQWDQMVLARQRAFLAWEKADARCRAIGDEPTKLQWCSKTDGLKRCDFASDAEIHRVAFRGYWRHGWGRFKGHAFVPPNDAPTESKAERLAKAKVERDAAYRTLLDVDYALGVVKDSWNNALGELRLADQTISSIEDEP